MSFQAKNPAVLEQQLKVQELVVRKADAHLRTFSTHSYIEIGEEVVAVVAVLHLNDSTPVCTMIAASALSIVTSPTTGVVKSAIKIASLDLDTDDVFIVKYIVAQ